MKKGIVLVFAASFLLVAPATAAPPGTAPKSRPHLVVIMAEGEYHTDKTLPPFAHTNLEPDFRVSLRFASKQDPNDIPGLEVLDRADLALISIRRRTLPPEQLVTVRRFLDAGKPLVAIRTSSHAFCLRNKPPREGYAEWPDFDQQVLGCHYHDHHGNQLDTFVHVVPQAITHPITKGITRQEFRMYGSLYKSLPLAKSATTLIMGRVTDVLPHEPVAWTNRRTNGGRVFYTSLGHPQDFTSSEFVRLLRNGIYWAAGLQVPDGPAKVLTDVPSRQ